MTVSKSNIPKLIKFSYRNKEFLWLKVDKFESNYYYGYVNNKPLSKGIAYNQYVRVHKNKVVDIMR